MIDQSRVQSGFDSEVLFGSRYIKYLLLNSVETGSLTTDMLIPVETDNGNVTLDIKLYLPGDYQRVYTPNALASITDKVHPDSFNTAILLDDPSGADLRITMIADIHAAETGQGMDGAVIDLFTTFRLTTEVDDAGNQKNAKININLVTIEGDIIDIAIALFNITRELIIEKMKPSFDRSIDLGIVGAGQNVQSIQTQKLPGDTVFDNAIGVYVNLKLRDGAEEDSFLPDRGDLSNALNFLPNEQDIAFGMPGGLFPKLGNDAFQKMAEETSEGSGNYTYPIHENPNDKESDVKGKISGISMYADNGTLVIDVSGEYFIDTPLVDIIPDPSFDFYIYIKPEINDGLITWKFDYDLDIGPLYEVLSVFIGVLLGIIFGPGGFIAGGILAAAVIGGQELIAEPIALNMIEDEAGSMVDASFFDALPHRLTVETRRWDPFYDTHHEIVAKTDAVQITHAGIGFSGVAILDKEPEPIYHLVIRNEKAGTDLQIEELWYRVTDFAAAANDFTSNFPASDRLEFVKVTGDAETNLFALTPDECKDRIAQLKLLPMIPYTAKKVHLVNNQVDHILVVSNKEVSELTSSLKNTFLRNKKDDIRNTRLDEITEEAVQELTEENGTAPTQEQIDERVEEKISALAQPALDDYVEGSLETDLADAINEILRYDLPPELMADLQMSKIMFLNGFVIINRLGKLYYRDRADGIIPDNLMSLPGYTPGP